MGPEGWRVRSSEVAVEPASPSSWARGAAPTSAAAAAFVAAPSTITPITKPITAIRATTDLHHRRILPVYTNHPTAARGITRRRGKTRPISQGVKEERRVGNDEVLFSFPPLLFVVPFRRMEAAPVARTLWTNTDRHGRLAIPQHPSPMLAAPKLEERRRVPALTIPQHPFPALTIPQHPAPIPRTYHSPTPITHSPHLQILFAGAGGVV
jgi:hypothetical protein